jgi:hypothetical protein
MCSPTLSGVHPHYHHHSLRASPFQLHYSHLKFISWTLVCFCYICVCFSHYSQINFLK